MKNNNVDVVKLAENMIEIAKQELLEFGGWENNSICTSIFLDNNSGIFNYNEDTIQNLSNAILDNEEVESITLRVHFSNPLEFNIKFY